jgi:hypothetical protein
MLTDMKKNQNKDISKEDSQNQKGTEKETSKDQPLPGEYPPGEDIMNRQNEMSRVNIDPDNLSRSPGANNNVRDERGSMDEEIFPPTSGNRKPARSKSDLTKEDYEALGPRDLSLDGGDDEQLKHRVWPVDFAAKDLDVPGGDDERLDALGQGDEENDHYSLGGDDKDNLEEDPTRTFG